MVRGEDMCGAVARGVLLIALLLAGCEASAQSPPQITDTTGGIAPASSFCPNTSVNTCWSSLAKAEAVLRSETPDVGQFLYQSSLGFYNAIPRLYYAVKNQPVESELPAAYKANDGLPQVQYCPNSIQPDNRCQDEAELIAGYTAKKIMPGVTRAAGWHTVIASNVRVEGSYVSPYVYTAGGVAREGTYFLGGDRTIVWDEWDIQDQVSRTRTMLLSGRRVFVCPAGMESIATTDVGIYPYLCKKINLTRFIYVKAKKQVDSECANPNPCHPSSGDKSRAETDFTFAGRAFTRYYHSLRESMPGGFRMGAGWTHSYAAQLHDGARLLVTSKGHWAPYINVSAGRWLVPNLGNAPLDQMPDGSWRLTEPSGDVSTFVGGRLTNIRTPGSPDRDVTLEYNASGRLSRIIDMTGKELLFAYNMWNQLSEITLPGGVVYTYSYDAKENLTAVASSGGGTKQYHYGEAGLSNNADPNLLTGITYEDGNRFASFGYDIHGRVLLSTLHAPGGQFTETTRVHYPTVNSAQVTLPSGLTQTYTYSADIYRKPLTVVDSGGTTTNTYDGFGRRLTNTDRRGVQTRYTYTNNRLTATTSAYGTTVQRIDQIDWHTTLGVPIERRTRDANNALVAKWTWTYNDRGQVLTSTQTDPVGGATRTSTNTYCEQAGVDGGTCPRVGLLLSVDGVRTDVADTTTYNYFLSDDPSCASAPTTCPHRKGDLWKVTDALGHVTETLAYEGNNRPSSIKDANGTITELTYHAQGWLTSRTVKGASPADDRSMLIDYWPTGLVKRVTQSDGSYTDYGYDPAKRLTSIEDSAGNAIHYTLDNAGNRTSEETRDHNGALTRTLSRVYDQLGRLESQADAYSRATGYTYDANGNTDVVTDALVRATDNDYDPLNRLTQTLQDVGGIAAATQFKYDAQDNLTRVIDPKGLDTDYTYNGWGDLMQLSSPDTGITGYTYDSAGNRKTQTDARGVTATYTYDVLNRLTGIAYPTASLDISYQYDTVNAACTAGESYAKGRLTGIADASGSTQYCYNRFGEMTRKRQVTNGQVFTTRYSYDVSGHLATQTYPDGAVLDTVRDADGRVTELGVTPAGGSRQVVVTGATYAPFGPTTGWIYGNSRTFSRSLNQNYQPVAIHDGGSGGLSLHFTFDEVGNLTKLQDAGQTQVISQYSYDALNRLHQTKDGPTGIPIETYGYDTTGNRQSVTHAGMTTTYSYPGTSHHLASVGGISRSYDAAGNTSGLSTGIGYAYSDAGRMELVTQGATVQAQYEYNGKGEQVRRAKGADNAYFVYDEIGHLLGEYDTNGTPIQQIVWFGDLPVGVLQGAGAGQQLHYIEPDHLGTPRVVIDGVRNVPIWNWDFKGEAFGDTPPKQDADGDGTAFVFDLRFLGQRYDSATGLNYNYFRDYDPGTGRYVESDPIGLRGGINTFSYVHNRPLALVDPLGLQATRGLPARTAPIFPSQGEQSDLDLGSNVLQFPKVRTSDTCPPDDQCIKRKAALMGLHFQIDGISMLESARGDYDSETIARKYSWNRAARDWNATCGPLGYPLIPEVWFYVLGPRKL